MQVEEEFGSTGIRYTSYQPTREEINLLKKSWQTFVDRDIPKYPGTFNGRGIVTCGGGMRYFTCAWVSINILRKKGCELPIELWYFDGEINSEIIEKLGYLNVVCKNVKNYSTDSLTDSLTGYALKPYAILNSSFKDVLFLDADNVCVRDPSYLFDSAEFEETGAIFWPDFWKTDINNPVWEIVDSSDFDEYEQESGQVLVNKEKSWNSLHLTLYFNLQRQQYYKFLLGDKDTFKFSWKALRKKYFMVQREVGYCGYSGVENQLYSSGVAMVQHDHRGFILFIHTNMAKWDIVKCGEYLWKKTKYFKTSAKIKKFIKRNVKLVNGSDGVVFDIDGDVLIENSDCDVQMTEISCHQVLEELRQSDFYLRFILDAYMSRMRREV